MSACIRTPFALAVLTGFSVATCGCTPLGEYLRNGFKVGPNYRRPAAVVACDWIDAGDVRVRKDSEDHQQWWTVFEDPTLNGLIINTVQQNLTLREAGYRVLQARAVQRIAAGNFFPQQQDAFGAYSRNALSVATANSSFLGFQPERFFDEWDLGFNLAWELDFWGRYRRAIEAADDDLDAAVANYDDVLVTLLADVASTYVEIRTLQRQISLVQANVDLQQKTLTIVKAKFDGGMVSELDVDQAASNLAQTQALIPQLEISVRQAELQLCVLLGIPPEDLTPIIGKGPIPTAPSDVVVGIPAELLTRRPDIRRAEREVAAQNARVGVAVSELYPHIGITGTIGYASEEFTDLFNSRALQGTVGPSFQWNVLNYGRLINAIRLQDARLAERITAYQNTVLNANAEVESGLVQFLRSQQQAQYMNTSVEAALRATNIALKQYEFGMVDFNRVALIEQNLVQQQDLFAQAEGAIALGLIEVYRALGGGWQIQFEPLPGPAPIPLPAPEAQSGQPAVPVPLPQPGVVPTEPLPPPANAPIGKDQTK